jgi:hypothetical protein
MRRTNTYSPTPLYQSPQPCYTYVRTLDLDHANPVSIRHSYKTLSEITNV